MKFSIFAFAMILAITLVSMPAVASARGGMTGKQMTEEEKAEWSEMRGKMREQHKQMMPDMMGMMKEMMGIIKGMSHSPTDAQKKRLEEMMQKMDNMMATHREWAEKKKKMRQKE